MSRELPETTPGGLLPAIQPGAVGRAVITHRPLPTHHPDPVALAYSQTNKTLREVGKEVNLTGYGVSVHFWKAVHMWERRSLYRQHTSTPEDVYFETEQWRRYDVGKSAERWQQYVRHRTYRRPYPWDDPVP